jgi:hypothetical protein
MENFEEVYKQKMAKAEERASALARILMQEGREQDMFRAAEDAKFAEALYREFEL